MSLSQGSLNCVLRIVLRDRIGSRGFTVVVEVVLRDRVGSRGFTVVVEVVLRDRVGSRGFTVVLREGVCNRWTGLDWTGLDWIVSYRAFNHEGVYIQRRGAHGKAVRPIAERTATLRSRVVWWRSLARLLCSLAGRETSCCARQTLATMMHACERGGAVCRACALL